MRETLSEVLEYWFFDRFKALTAREIARMLQTVGPIQETRAYRDIFAEGEAEGEAKGKAMTLKRQAERRFGTLPAWAAQRIESASVAQLDAWLDGIFDAPSVEDLLREDGGHTP